MTPFLCLGCFKVVVVCVSLCVDSERLTYFRFCVKNIFKCKFIHCSTCTAGSGLHIGPPSFFYWAQKYFILFVVCVRKNYHHGEEDTDGCNAEY